MSNIRSISIDKKQVPRIKNSIELDNVTERKCINTLYLNGDCGAHQKLFVSSLDRKIAGYKSQDIKKGIHNITSLISHEDLLEKLVASKLKCYYCSKSVKILYSMARDPLQWSLDRLNNDDSHTKDNTVIACLDCNLKRRRRDAEKFYFTKNMNIIKGS